MTDIEHARSVVVLISGRGTNMEAIVASCRAPHSHGRVRAVLCDRPEAAGLERAAALGVPTHCLSPGDYPDREAYDRALADRIAEFEPAVVALAGFMRILSPAFVRAFAGRLLNIHPSLLPKYRGLHTHRRVLAAGDVEHGASVHFVTEELDAGPVICQARVPVHPGDSVDALSARVQAVEHIIYPRAVDLLASGRLELHGANAVLDGRALAGPLSLALMEGTSP